MKANQPITVKDNRYDRKEMSLKTFIDKQSQIYLHLMISPGCSYVQLSKPGVCFLRDCLDAWIEDN